MTKVEHTDPLREQALLVAALLDQLGVMDAGARGRAHAARPLAALVLAGFDRLLAEQTPPLVAASGAEAPLSREEAYVGLIHRARQQMEMHVPHGGKVAVISRGDRRLTEVPGRTITHFPQDDQGGWAGHYPATGSDAVSHLDAVRARGARWLAIPSPASWWLDHYHELGHHLTTIGRLVVADPDLALWALDAPQPEQRPAPAVHPLSQLVRALVPDSAAVIAMASKRGPSLAADVQSIPGAVVENLESTTWRTIIDRHAGQRNAYVVLPGDSSFWRINHPELWQHLAATHRLLANRPGLGSIFELYGATAVSTPTSTSTPPPHTWGALTA